MELKQLHALVLVALLSVVVGCETKKQATQPGGSESGASAPAGAAGDATSGDAAGDATASSAEKFGEGSIQGVVKVTGSPARPALDVSAKPECVQARGGQELLSEKIVAGADGTLKDVVVYISKGISGRYATPAESVVIDQKGCQYVPHVFAIQVNQTLEIKNSDPFLHNVSNPSSGMNLSMPNVGTETKKRFFKQAGVASLFQCSVHPWMSAYAFVTDNPFFAVTGDDGAFSIEKLPAGTYTVSVWHEPDRKLKTPEPQVIEVKDGEATAPITFEFQYEG